MRLSKTFTGAVAMLAAGLPYLDDTLWNLLLDIGMSDAGIAWCKLGVLVAGFALTLYGRVVAKGPMV